MIFRSKHKGDYTRINNSILRDTTLSDGARSLLVYMLSMSDEWTFSVRSLAAQFNVTKNTIDARILELKERGYIRTRKEKGKNGRFFSCTWEIYEEPCPKITVSQNFGVPKKPCPENLGSQKIGTIRTINIKEQSRYKEQSMEKKAPAKKCPLGPFENVLLTNEEQKDLTDRLGFDEVVLYIDRLSNYLHEHPEKKYKSHKATIERWIRQDEGSA